jgi:hypothetical protein
VADAKELRRLASTGRATIKLKGIGTLSATGILVIGLGLAVADGVRMPRHFSRTKTVRAFAP